MFRELVALGQQLETEGFLVPVGFKEYRKPIRWVAHLRQGKEPSFYLEEAVLNEPRPYAGRRSNIRPHPVADEAAYVFAGFSNDPRAKQKHSQYLRLFERLLGTLRTDNVDLRVALQALKAALEQGLIEKDGRFPNVQSKDWISLVVEDGPLAGQHLFKHPEVIRAWAEELAESLSQQDGQCSICGKWSKLLRFIPSVKLHGMAPLHSLNDDAYVSFIGLPGAAKKAHVGICYPCGDTAARAFNHLRDDPNHHRELIRDQDKPDSLDNHIALFWLKEPPALLSVGELELDWDEMLASLGDVVAERELTPEPDITHVRNLVALPWKPCKASLNLDDYAFYLALLSPNVGRIAVREWLSVSLSDLRQNLKNYFDALSIVGPQDAEPRPVSMRTAQWAIEAKPGEPLNWRRIRRIAKDTGLVRSLVRCAFMAARPSQEILKQAVPRWRKTEAKQPKDERERQQQEQRRHGLAALIKLVLTYNKPEAQTMEMLNTRHNTPAYLCGRILAILEEIQLRAHRWRINTTVVDRTIGAASTAPASILGTLMIRAEKSHLPKIRKENLGHDKLKQELEQVSARLDEAGGFPLTLPMHEQAEFALGFYHQRAHYRSQHGKISDSNDKTQSKTTTHKE